eukprot:TRINITY_DN3505_c0_g1_i1.p1 TRINITY_DN3505_c0_g1~~TRINITY_DN3505_c0_g1_i1.p1  ORF type:complete len:573 (+),score=196.61 TRINITY_DN3505_c0_g1_i1:55-1773(+)
MNSTDEHIHHHDEDGGEVIYSLYAIGSVLSLIGSSTILISFILVRELRHHPYSLVFFISLCDFFFALKFLMLGILQDTEISEQFCFLQSIWTQFWGFASVSWNGMVSLNLIIDIYRPFSDSSVFFPLYQLYVWGSAIATTVILAKFGWLGHTDETPADCWIKRDQVSYSLVFFGPVFVYLCLGFYATCLFIFRLRTIPAYDRMSSFKMSLRMTIITVVFMVLWATDLVLHITIAMDFDVESLVHTDAFLLSIQGLFNAFVWVSSPYFISHLKKNRFCRWTFLSICCMCVYCFSLGRSSMSEEEEMALSEGGVKEDAHNLNYFLRKNMLFALLTSIKFKLYASRENTPESRQNLSHNLKKELFGDLLHNRLLLPENGTPYEIYEIAPSIFQRIRTISKISDQDFMISIDAEKVLASLEKQKFSEGKSGSFFCFTPDNSFVIKTLFSDEVAVLTSILPSYFEYLCVNPNTLLPRFLGAYHLKSPHGNDMFYVVMGNFFNTSMSIDERYDLKGSWTGRKVEEEKIEKNPRVLRLDLNINKPIELGEKRREKMLTQIASDSKVTMGFRQKKRAPVR